MNVLLFVLCAASCQASPFAAKDAGESTKWVLVLRHHPGIIDCLDDRRHDGELIFKHLDKSKVSAYRHEGGLGSGYELTIPRSSLAAWKEMIDNLHKKKMLRYYKSYKLDKYGYGLVPLPKK